MRACVAYIIPLLAAGNAWADVCAATAADNGLKDDTKDRYIKNCQLDLCTAGANLKQLAGPDRTNFIKRCQAGEVRPDGGEQALSGSPRPRCPEAIDRCRDPSTDLEATAAGTGVDPGANSGHSFVRLKRLPR